MSSKSRARQLVDLRLRLVFHLHALRFEGCRYSLHHLYTYLVFLELDVTVYLVFDTTLDWKR